LTVSGRRSGLIVVLESLNIDAGRDYSAEYFRH